MFIAITGGHANDRKKILKETLAKEFPRATFLFSLHERVPSDDELLSNAYQSEGFFKERTAILLKDIGNDLLATLKKETVHILGVSETPFVLLDESLLKASTDILKEARATIVKIEAHKKIVKKENIFAICDAFSSRDKFLLWRMISEALFKGESPEALVGILFSRIRTMLRDQRPGKYTMPELEAVSSSLALLLSRSRERGNDSALSLEYWALKLPNK